LSQPQRLALEQWMLHKADERGTGANLEVVDPCMLSQKHQCNRQTAGILPSAAMRLRALSCARPLSCKPRNIRGVVSQVSLVTGTSSSYALLCVGMLRLTSRKSRDLTIAVQHREALLAVRSHMADDVGTLEDRLRRAMAEVLPKYHLNLQRMGLRVSVRVWVHRWIGLPLATPTFRAADMAGLERGLRAWRRLHDARQLLHAAESKAGYHAPSVPGESAAWAALREVFLNIEEETGLDRTVRVARLAQAEKARERHREQLSEDWNRRQMRVADRNQHLWSKQEETTFATKKTQSLLRKLSTAEQKIRHCRQKIRSCHAKTSREYKC